MSAYVGRLNYSATIATIIDQGVFTKSQAGLTGTIFFFCYGGGQFLNGFIADRLSPFKMIFIGLSLSATANLLMSFNTNFVIISIIWGINGFAQSMLWASIVFIITNIIHEDFRYKASLYIASSFPVGTLAAYSLAIISSYYKWNTIFAISSGIMFVVAALWVIISIKVNNEIKRDTEDTPADVTYEINNNEVIKEDNKISKLLVISGLSTVLVAVLIHGMLKDGIMTWVPTMITEKYSVKPSFAIFLTMVLPVINLFGAFIATLIFKRLKNHDEIKASLFFMAGPVIPFIVLIFIGKIPVVLSIALLAVITMSMTAFNHIYLTLVPQRFRGFGKTATITGIINSIVYIGSALSNYGFGMISEKLGWDYTICFWIIIAVIGTASCLMSLRKWREFIVSADKKQ